MYNIDIVLDNINSLIKEKKITKTEFYNSVKISSGNFSDWKSGKCNPSNIALHKIAEYFDCSIDYLLGREEKKEDSQEISPQLTKLEKIFLEKFRKLDPFGKQSVDNIIEKELFRMTVEKAQAKDRLEEKRDPKREYIAALGGGVREVPKDIEVGKILAEKAIPLKYNPNPPKLN